MKEQARDPSILRLTEEKTEVQRYKLLTGGHRPTTRVDSDFPHGC